MIFRRRRRRQGYSHQLNYIYAVKSSVKDTKNICVTPLTAYKKKREEFKLPLFGLATIAAATKNFSDENMIGQGGFGPVYKVKYLCNST